MNNKKNIIFTILLIFSIGFTSISNADTTSNNIAIGLKFASTSVSSASFKSNGLCVSNGSKKIDISTDKTFTVKPIQINTSSESYSTYLSSGIKDDEFIYSSDLSSFYPASTSSKYNNSVSTAIGIYNESGKLIFATSEKSNLSFSSTDNSPFEIFNIKYRGSLKFIRKDSKLSIINYLDVEDYLKGVIAKEMVSSWNMEALKAQAIAARSFAYSNYNKFSSYGFNLTADTRSQAYGGYSAETVSTTKAVDDTKDIVGLYNGKIAELIYNASSGGKTESAKNIWGAELPYLTAKDDPYSLDNPYSNWTVIMSASQIESSLKSLGKDIGSLQSISLDTVTPNGYVMKITFHGSKSDASFTKDSVRGVLGASKLKSAYFTILNPSLIEQGALHSIPTSNEFNILDKYILANFGTTLSSSDSYTFLGHGYGHGVGMSQYGAKYMADKGNNYKQILEFYYPNIVFETKK